MALHFDITGDNSNFLRKLEETKRGVSEAAKFMESQGKKIDSAFNKISLGTLEKFREIMSELPNGAKELEPFKKQIADLEKRISEATKRIIELQNQAKQPTAVNTNTGNIKQESSAYESLLESIKDVLGARGSNVAAMLQEQNAIRLNQRELKVLEGIEIKGLKLSEAQQARRIQLVNSISEHKQAIASLRQVISNEIKLEQAATTSMDEMSQSLGRMRMAYRQLSEQERNSKFGKDLLISIQEADTKIKQLDASIGNHARNVGDYKQKWNGLQYQMQMVAREMPNFAINPQTGIISLTNNLPYLVDELKKAKDAHKAYIAEVKAGNTDLKAVPSVGKQILSSLFNWQTALIMGITLITAYRKEITEWVGGLFDAKDAIKSLKDAENDINEKFVDNTKGISQQIIKLRELQEKWKSLGGDINAQKKFIQDAKSDFDNLGVSVSTVNDAESLLIKNTPAFIEALKLRAQATAAKELSEEKYKEYLSKRQKALDESQKEPSTSDKLKRLAYNLFEPSTSGVINTKEQEDVLKSFQGQRIKGLMDEAEAAKADAESYFTLNQAKEEAATVKINSILPDSKVEIQNKDFWTNQKNSAISALDAIDSKQKTILDNAAKDTKKDLHSLDIDKSIVDSYKSAVKAKEEAEKELKAYPSSSDNKQESSADKLRKEQEKRNEELLSLRRQNQQDDITLLKEGTDKKLKQIELDYQKETDAIKKQEKEWSKEQGGKLTREQSIEISTRYTNAEDIQDKNIADTTKEQLKAEQQALNDYLKEYGTFQQQKLAIAEEYAEKIKKAQEESGINSAQVKLLEKQRDVAIQDKETEAIKASIDWVTVFGEFGGMFNDMIKPALEEAKKYVQTDKFKNSDQASQKSLIDAINQMEKSLGGVGGVNFKKLGQDVQIYQNALRDLNNAKEEEIDAINRLKKAQEDYEKAVKNGTEQEKRAAKDALDNAQDNANAASSNVKTQTDIANQSQQDVTNTATGLKASMENVTAGLSKLASGGLSNAYSGIIQATNGIKDAIGKTSESLREVPIIGWILSIIDVLKDGLSNLVGGLLDAIFNAVGGIISDVLSGDLFVTIGKSLISGVGNILNSITFGGFNSLFGADGNSKEVNKLVGDLTESNKYLITAIDKLTNEMEKSGGKEATEYYNSAVDKQKDKTENDRQMLAARMGRNASHHSNNYYINDAFNSDDWKRASDYVGKQMKSAGDLWKLTPEELAKLQELPDIWQKINSGKYDESSYLDTYIENAEKVEELTSKWHESLNQMSLDSFRDGFLSTLEDMDASSEDFAKNFEGYLKKSILNALIADKYTKDIEDLYDAWAEAGEDGEYTKEEADALREKQQKIADAMLAERDAMADTFGWASEESTSQNSTKGMSQSMSQDTGDELNGRFTAFQISNEEIKNSMLSMLVSMNLISVSTNTNGITLMEIKNIALMSNSHLEDIAKYTKELIGFKQTIANIETSAKAMAGK